MEEIFKSLDINQVKINSLEDCTLCKSCNKYNRLKLFKNKYSNHIYFILFVINNTSVLENTLDEQIKLYDDFSLKIIDEINNKLFNKFNYKSNKCIKKKILMDKIKNKIYNGYDIYKFISDYFQINIYIKVKNFIFIFMYDKDNKNYFFENNNTEYELVYINDYNVSADEIDILREDNIIIEDIIFLEYKTYKVDKLKDLSKKCKLSLYDNKKIKNKDKLIDDLNNIFTYI